MANERDNDLPLIVSEILIELHEMRTDIRNLTLAFGQQQVQLQEIAAGMKAQIAGMQAQTDSLNTFSRSLIDFVKHDSVSTENRFAGHEQRIQRLEATFRIS